MKNKRLRFLAQVLDSIKRGWLSVEIEGRDGVELPFSTKLYLIRKGEKFETAKVLEGYYKNCIVHIPYMIKGSRVKYSYLSSELLYTSRANLILKSNQLVVVNSKLRIKVLKNSLEPGIYTIKFPIRKLQKQINPIYLDEFRGGSRFAETWFPIFKREDLFMQRYIHFGAYSKGCVTTEYKFKKDHSTDWYKLYIYLMRSRDNKGDLGTLVVK